MRIERVAAGSKLAALAALKLGAAGALLLTGLAALPVLASEAATAASTVRNQVGCPMTRPALERAAEGVLRRLEDPECQRVFADFRDAEGRPLQETLEALRETGSSYLTRRMWFADGSGSRACQWSEAVAVTRRGSPVVFVCARQFRKWAFHDPAFLETVLIHEELHSLGLGENPPSSLEINERIARRCGRR